jgi:hypothetical protein
MIEDDAPNMIWDYGYREWVRMSKGKHIEEGHMLYEGHIVYKIIPLTNADLQSIARSYRHWIDDLEQEEDWWAGHGYDKDDLDTDGRAFTFDINFVMASIYYGYDRVADEIPDPNDFGVWLYPLVVDAREGQRDMPLGGIDVTDEFKAYLEGGQLLADWVNKTLDEKGE